MYEPRPLSWPGLGLDVNEFRRAPHQRARRARYTAVCISCSRDTARWKAKRSSAPPRRTCRKDSNESQGDGRYESK